MIVLLLIHPKLSIDKASVKCELGETNTQNYDRSEQFNYCCFICTKPEGITASKTRQFGRI